MANPEINKYQGGKIYKILNTINDEVYVGSTCQKLLSKRMGKHREDALRKTYPLYKHMNEIGIDKFYIELIMNYPCNSKDELVAKEREWIRNIGTLNKRIEGRTNKEYYEDNKDHILERNKIYREEHKEQILEYRQRHYEENKEQILQQCKERYDQNKEIILQQHKEYREENKEKIAEQKKEYYEQNKETINDYKKEWYKKNKEAVLERVKQHAAENKEEKKDYDKQRYQQKKTELSIKTDCPCGGCYAVMSKNKHFKTKVHQNYEETTKDA